MICPNCSAPSYRMLKYEFPNENGEQRWLCCACDHIWIPQRKDADESPTTPAR